MPSELLSAVAEDAAQEALQAMGCTDGLPVIVPTLDRVGRMMRANRVSPDVELGLVAPSFSPATVEAVAVAAVMAGCSPASFPVLVASVRAVCDPRFELPMVQGSSQNVAPLIIVNGPIRETCAIASGVGCLGPGYRANATIGRALRLVLLNVGGGLPGVGDMAGLGQPAKFTFCVAEAERASPWPALHVTRHFDPDESVVTVSAGEGPHQVCFLPGTTGRSGASADDFVDLLAATLLSPGSVGFMRCAKDGYEQAQATVILNPTHAKFLADAHYDRARLQAAVAERAAVPLGLLRRFHPAYLPHQSDTWSDAQLFHVFPDPEQLLVIVAGAPIPSAVIPGFSHGAPVSIRIEDG